MYLGYYNTPCKRSRKLMYNKINMTQKEKAEEVVKRLKKIYPHPKTALNFTTPLELLIATILSAQCTDKVINLVTPDLFKKYRSAQDYASAPVEEINEMIKKVTFHNNKAKSVKAACEMLVAKYNGKVPETMDELDGLPGVARKTANVVLGQAFGKAEGVVVDTHVRRLANKLGLTKSQDPVKIEEDLMREVAKKDWIFFSSALILYGREYAPARGKGKNEDILEDLYV